MTTNPTFIMSTPMPPPTITVSSPPSNIISINSTVGPIVIVKPDGTIEWPDGVDITTAAEAFGKCLQLGTELSAGINKSVKQRMKDQCREGLKEYAELHGPLSVEDIERYFQEEKVFDILQGT